MIKRIFCIILSVIFLLGLFPVEGEATDESSVGNTIYQTYIDNEYALNEWFAKDTAVYYWKMINHMEKWQKIIDVASMIVEKYPGKQVYAEILANLIMMQSGSLAEQVQTQSKFDNLKDGWDYMLDIADIAEEFVGGSDLLKNISPIIDAVSGGNDVIVKSKEQAKYFETVIKDYSQAHDFLSTVSRYAENKELRETATALLDTNEKLLQKRLEYLSDTTETLAKYEAKFFIKNLSYELLKNTELYKENQIVKKFVDCGNKIADSLSTTYSQAKVLFKAIMLTGDINFGTSNTFYRYQEMKTMADIAQAIVKANQKVKVSDDVSDARVFDSIKVKCNYYRMLITTHARGNYLLYQLLTQDAGILSELRVSFDSFKETDDTMDAWYQRQKDVALNYYEILEEILSLYPIEESSEEDKVSNEVNNTEYSEVYNSYKNAVMETTESGSWTENLTMTTNLIITKGSSKTKAKVTLDSNMNISNYSSDDISSIYMCGSANMKVMGQIYEWDIVYENGTATYQYTKPNQTSSQMKIDPNYFNFESFTDDMLSDAKVSGNKIKFTVSGEKMDEVGIAAVKQMNGVDNLRYEDITVVVTTNNEGKIKTITMSFDASMTYQGYNAEANYEIIYDFS